MTHNARIVGFLAFLRGRLIVPAISIHFLCSVPAAGQKPGSTLGPLVDLELPYAPAGVATMRSSRPARTEIAVLEQGGNGIHLYSLTGSGELTRTDQLPLEDSSAIMLAADLSGDGADELITVSAEPPVLTVHRRTAGGFTSWSLRLSSAVERVAAGDVNNDRRTDLLLFGRSLAGVQVLTGGTGGSLHMGPLLFPDISVSDLGLADLNGDRIADIVLADWLSDRVVTFYGIGRGVFSEQVAVSVEAEPSHIVLTPRTKLRTYAVAVSLRAQGIVAVYEGNATGELELRETLDVQGQVNRLVVARVNPDAYPDLLLLTESSVAVAAGISATTFAKPVVFGPGRDISGLAVADLDGDRWNDLVAVSRSDRRLIVIGNSYGKGGVAWPAVYSVGIDPHGLVVRDLNGDGFTDIATANQGSASVSILAGRSGGGFWGQEAIEVAPQPIAIRSADPRGAASRTMITSHEAGEMVTIVRFDAASEGFRTMTVPTGARPSVLLAREDTSRQTFEMLVRYAEGKERSLSLSLFEQAGAHQFIERSLRPSVTGRVLALTVDEVSQGGRYDLVFVAHDRADERSALSIAPSQGGFDFRTIRQILAYSDPDRVTHSVLSALIDRDDHKDLLLLLGAPRNSVGVLYGRGEGRFRDSLEWIADLRPVGDDDVLLDDVDGNGTTDLVCLDRSRGIVVVAYQEWAGGFRHPVAVHEARGATGFAIANLRSPTQHDLLLTRGGRGSVSITFDAFRK